MLDFNFCVPTNFIFGRDTHKKVGETIKGLGYKKVLVNYGGTFLQETGLLDVVLNSLKNSGLEVVELDGVLPNPRLGLVYRGIELCRAEKVDIVLAIGGGSTIDTCKAIAAGVPYKGDVWDYYMTGEPVLEALPIGVILTIPASGSESGCGSMITNEENGLKRGAGGPGLYPKFAICNPELTYSLPTVQTACGMADMFTHVCERYFSNTQDTYIIDAMDEGFFRSLIEIAPKLLKDPNNYNLRSEIMWMGTIAHNDTLGIGRVQDWGTHDMGHEISGMYDTTHAFSMSIMLIAWMKYVYTHDIERFVRYAKYAFSIKTEGKTREEIALEGIQSTEMFMKDIGMPVRLSEIGISDTNFEEMADKALIGKEHIGNFVELKKDDIIKIYQLAK
ncbi:iron-containing alcohol dehydrogenase [Mediterraneibacter sp. NSJ-55]|uniref:Iron-containing alcohol dehydrogenase n=1 Tax=Mediterraneibacter hominis TaxID=2763054 RepID=A0A923LKM5_9FIRM|nr:iron-containing alcohol dehydrogenase [Mediterraneibacter hominis]MBC5690565.1 iron-containing alcohol dehydrogenase [Mediterraneibacter hominis]